ncbi:phosphotransferase family protein [Streptomyces carpinensis]|uniref:Phosphotransferase n=1 Tax=Streptomyces carpinensis TaxID=66369 RepID=A0ABV1W0Z4_9ACTN|nr:phosphotransferase [Streptomyces carpinensis]
MQSQTKRSVSPRELDAMLRASAGAGCRLEAELADGWFNTAYRVALDDGRPAVVKIAPSAGAAVLRYELGILATEAMVYRRIAGLPDGGMPAPSLLHVGKEFLVISLLQGTAWDKAADSLSPTVHAALRRELGAIARLHTLAPEDGRPLSRPAARHRVRPPRLQLRPPHLLPSYPCRQRHPAPDTEVGARGGHQPVGGARHGAGTSGSLPRARPMIPASSGDHAQALAGTAGILLSRPPWRSTTPNACGRRWDVLDSLRNECLVARPRRSAVAGMLRSLRPVGFRNALTCSIPRPVVGVWAVVVGVALAQDTGSEGRIFPLWRGCWRW